MTGKHESKHAGAGSLEDAVETVKEMASSPEGAHAITAYVASRVALSDAEPQEIKVAGQRCEVAPAFRELSMTSLAKLFDSIETIFESVETDKVLGTILDAGNLTDPKLDSVKVEENLQHRSDVEAGRVQPRSAGSVKPSKGRYAVYLKSRKKTVHVDSLARKRFLEAADRLATPTR